MSNSLTLSSITVSFAPKIPRARLKQAKKASMRPLANPAINCNSVDHLVHGGPRRPNVDELAVDELHTDRPPLSIAIIRIDIQNRCDFTT
jgi:hypothetical protein